MKREKMLKWLFALILGTFLLYTVASAQGVSPKNDEIVLRSGGLMVGHVIEMGAQQVRFVLKGERLSYAVPKNTIHKIRFAGGRTQLLNQPTATPAGRLTQDEITVTTLPMVYPGKVLPRKLKK